MELKDILKPIDNELEIFDDYFHNAMKSKVAFVDMIARYIMKRKGKRIRPALVLLTAKACGNIDENSYRGASLVEILHTATLIHDDVVDEADTRRGFPSLNAVWKNKISVLMGDYLLAKGLLLSLDNNDFQFLKITSDAVRRMSEAEILQIKKSRDLDIDEPTYLKIISDKTASLFATCCAIGAASVTDDKSLQNVMADYGENLGMIFQIRDDLLDFTSRRSITGKPTGLDVKEKKLTLPIIYSLTKATRTQAKEIISTIKDGGKKNDLKHVVDLVHNLGGIEYTITKAEHYSGRALEALKRLGNSAAKDSLTKFVEFVMERKN